MWRLGLQARAQPIDVGPGRACLTQQFYPALPSSFTQQFDLTRIDRVGDRDRVLVKIKSYTLRMLGRAPADSLHGGLS